MAKPMRCPPPEVQSLTLTNNLIHLNASCDLTTAPAFIFDFQQVTAENYCF